MTRHLLVVEHSPMMDRTTDGCQAPPGAVFDDSHAGAVLGDQPQEGGIALVEVIPDVVRGGSSTVYSSVQCTFVHYKTSPWPLEALCAVDSPWRLIQRLWKNASMHGCRLR